MLQTRVITAVCMAALIVLLLFYVEIKFFKITLCVLCAVFAFEWSNLSGLANRMARAIYIVLSVVMLSLMLYSLALFDELVQLLPLAKNLLKHLEHTEFSLIQLLNFNGIIWAFILLWVISYPASAIFWRSTIVRLILGWCVLLPFFGALVAIRASADGIAMILYILLLVAAADVGAYFTGKTIGRSKLLYNVSPGKTWEGFCGGLVFAAAIALLTWSLGWDFGLSRNEFIAIALLSSLMGVLGDLFESMLKRFRGIKDSSNLLPGHGGFLDRVDSHLAAIPIFYFFLLLLTS